jgi:cholesterol transport system auxiliary component
MVGAVLAAIAGCALAPSRAEVRTYALAEAQGRPGCTLEGSGAPADGTLLISPPRARPGFDSPRMAYVERPYTLNFFTRSRWVDAPARLLGPLMMSCLAQTRGFRAVTLGPTSLAADWRLDADIESFEQEFTRRPSEYRVALGVQLVNMRTGGIVGQRSFEQVTAAPSDDPYGGVVAANRALAAVLSELARWTVSVAQRQRP